MGHLQFIFVRTSLNPKLLVRTILFLWLLGKSFNIHGQQQYEETTKVVCECMSEYDTFQDAFGDKCLNVLIEGFQLEAKFELDTLSSLSPYEQGRQYGKQAMGPIFMELLKSCNTLYSLLKQGRQMFHEEFKQEYDGPSLESIDLLLEGGVTRELQLEKAMYYMGTKNLKQAEQYLNELIAQYPAEPVWFMMAATVYELQGDFKKAVSAYEETLKYIPSNSDYYWTVNIMKVYFEREAESQGK